MGDTGVHTPRNRDKIVVRCDISAWPCGFRRRNLMHWLSGSHACLLRR